MTTTVKAVYEQGLLRLLAPIPLEEGTHVEVIVIIREPASTEQSSAEILASIAAIPLESGEEFSGRDHDRILYGEKGER